MSEDTSENRILASIIIPMRNEERYIGACLDSILENEFPRDRYEIIVVDGMSKDSSRAIVNRMMDRHSCIRLLDNPKSIVPTGLNSAICQARGEYVLIMGAHATYPSNFIRTCIQELEKSNADSAGGTMITKPGADTLIARAIALLSAHRFGVGNSGFRIGWGDRFVDTLPYPVFRKNIFKRVGLYRENLVRHQDFELNARIRATGGKLFLSSKIQNVYYSVPTFAKMVRQGYANGLWSGRAWMLYPISFRCRHVVPLAFLLVVLSAWALTLMMRETAWFLFLIVGTYFVCALVAAVQLAIRHGIKFFVLLPGLFVAYHFSYGLGTLIGLMTFPMARSEQYKSKQTKNALSGQSISTV
jgi:glycosyltransferase involved in cell wall biosynthesis